MELRLDGASGAACSGETRNVGNADVAKVQSRAQGSGNHDLCVDDVYVCDTSGPQNTDSLGDVRGETLRPSADTAQAGWAPSTGTDHYAVVSRSCARRGTRIPPWWRSRTRVPRMPMPAPSLVLDRDQGRLGNRHQHRRRLPDRGSVANVAFADVSLIIQEQAGGAGGQDAVLVVVTL